ncbi:MAG: hypothetical protein AB7H66_08805 [Hyphomonadaceae bacterium]
MSVQQEAEAFVASYVDAFTRWDVDAACAHWAGGGLFLMPAGNAALDASAFRDNVAKLMDFYRRQHVAHPDAKLVSCAELFPGLAEVRVTYRLFDSAAAEIVAWEHIYLLRKTKRWFAVLAVADGEIAAWAARGTPLGEA